MSPLLSPKEYKTRAQGRAAAHALQALFDTTSLISEADADTAVGQLDHILSDIASGDIHEFVSVLAYIPYLLEFVLSVSSDYMFALLSSVLTTRPNTAQDFLFSTAARLLNQFSLSLSDAPSVKNTTRRQTIELASSALETLSRLEACGTLAEEDVEQSDSRWAAKSREKRERGRRRSTVSNRGTTVDVQPIRDYGGTVPSSKPQARALATKIIDDQMEVLKDFLQELRTEATAQYVKEQYLPYIIQTGPAAASPTSESQDFTLYFASAAGFGPWRLSISTRAGRDLRRARNEDAKRFDIILKKIRDLSNGYFTKDNHKMLSGGKIDVPIYEAKMTRDSRLVYHIHCDLDFESKVERQVIRVFGIYTHAQIDQRFWDAMSRQLGSKGPEYRKRQGFSLRATKRDHAVLPGEFPPMEETPPAALSPAADGMTRENMEQLHSLLALEKFVTFSQEFLNNIIADQDVAHVFDLSPHEQEIMAHPSSCFVLGRSGTGKTTTMLFKMLAKERSWADRFRASMSKPRQLFVTQSVVLAQKVQEYFARLTQAFATANLSPEELRKMATANELRREAARIRMVDEDEEVHWNSALPARYGALSDADFPLFVTYDHLCRLLEGEFRHLLETNKMTSAQASILRDILQLRPGTSAGGARALYMADKKFSFVDYDGFRENYWAHFPGSLKQSLNPELVFGEFLGVIKGSEEALACEAGFLHQELYCGSEDQRTGAFMISRRTQATSPAQREAIYALFELYTRMKKSSHQYDAADRTRMLIKCFGAAGVPGRPLSFVYVDEVQDNLLIDSLVLRKLCPNPHGLFWAGDTAQTISTGSAFRFNDLKAFMYRGEFGPVAKREQSETFHLTTNYRSHSGIVDCAYSLVEVIVKYWPDSIDRLPQERGMTAGPKPLFFSHGEGGELQQALFRDPEGGSIEFGTHQCILVRNNAARLRLREEMGDVGQILTIYESKGLEFDDVLLYNPFEDSSVSYSQWAVLLNEVEGQRAPVFEEAKFTDICRELKHLYVAITRARMNLWIFDCSLNAEPLRLLWMAKNLVEMHPPNEPVPRLAVSSSKEEWAEAARSLFSKRHYSEAKLGFERAGLHHERDIALAYMLREEALSAPAVSRVGTGPSQSKLFSQAAKQFKAVADAEESEPEKRAYYRIAAECFSRCGAHHRAGVSYRAAEEYTLAAQAYRKAGSFDDAVEIIKSHTDDVEPEVVQKIRDVSRLHYIREDKIENARALFEDDEEALEYMDDYGLDASRATLLERLGRFSEAAECCLQEGERLKAIELLVRDHSQLSTTRAAECILDGLWQLLSLCTPEEHWQNDMIPDLLGQFELLDRTWVDDNALNELLMFRAVFADDVPALAELGDGFARVDNAAATVLCFDQVFSHSFALEDVDLDGITICFGRFLSMVRTLAWLVCQPNPCDQKAIQKLLAFRPSSEETFFVSSSTHLFTLCNKQSTPGMQTTANGVLVPRWELEPLVKTTLRDRLKGHVEYQNEMCHTALHIPGRLQPCLLFAANQACPKYECRQIHVQDGVITYNTLIRIHVIQIMIYHTLYACDIPYKELFYQQRYETFYLLGTFALLTLTSQILAP
ncbi:hypothetical protein C8Q80DRAFT_1092486 [Daedaleopsis nitida]|nr:hypothetical protein C8Q80DRAFT_1092486 [Daedaleopsis nitida]